jgi:hypothetical protein
MSEENAVTEIKEKMQLGVFPELDQWRLLSKRAEAFANSTLVPAQYRRFNQKSVGGGEKQWDENPSATQNCIIALDMAARMGANSMMVMQNLHIIEGRTSWSSTWIIAAINTSGKFSPLRFDVKDLGEKQVTYSTTEWVGGKRTQTQQNAKIRNLECTAWAIEKGTGERIDGPTVSIEMAVKEGWYGKTGSKWQTMPEVMLRYRAAAFFGRIYAPELLMGIQSEEEVRDIVDINERGDVVAVTPEQVVPAPKKSGNAAVKAKIGITEAPAPEQAPDFLEAVQPEHTEQQRVEIE